MSPVIPTLKPVTARFGGTPCRLRLLHAGDVGRLQSFFKSHTPETIQERYGFQMRELTPERASQLVNVNQARDLAVGIFAPAGRAEVIHAVGRYCLDDDGRSGEVAFVVRESMRNKGMARALMRVLIATARRRGLRSLWGQVSSDNGPMLNLFRRHGFKLAPDPLIDAVRATLDLSLARLAWAIAPGVEAPLPLPLPPVTSDGRGARRRGSR
jgi:GNAT superfamily N-acetyltransferase